VSQGGGGGGGRKEKEMDVVAEGDVGGPLVETGPRGEGVRRNVGGW